MSDGWRRDVAEKKKPPARVTEPFAGLRIDLIGGFAWVRPSLDAKEMALR